MERNGHTAGYLRFRMNEDRTHEYFAHDVLFDSLVKALVDCGEMVASVDEIPAGRIARWGMGKGFSKIVLENW